MWNWRPGTMCASSERIFLQEARPSSWRVSCRRELLRWRSVRSRECRCGGMERACRRPAKRPLREAPCEPLTREVRRALCGNRDGGVDVRLWRGEGDEYLQHT